MNLAADAARAADEDAFLDQIHTPSEQTMGYGRSAVWTLPQIATQYQPAQPTPVTQAAMQAQQEARFLDALIVLDDARKSGKITGDAEVELNLLRASFLLQGNEPKQALESLSPLLANTQHAADAHALSAMAYLQQGQMQKALDAAQHAQSLGGGILPSLVLSYALQGMGRLAEAYDVMHGFNTRTPQSAIALAREAELALTLDQIQTARALVAQAHQMDATHPYVIAVSGLVYLIDGQAPEAKVAFETALHRDPKDAKALLGLGLAETELGNFQAGQAKLQAANEADPDNALILTYLGRSQQQLGQPEAAKSSWRSAQQADPKDPVPWLYQAQAELQANQPMEARESLRQAQERLAYRSVYRGEHLLKDDQQLLQANLAEVQRQLGMENLAFHTLSDSVGEKNSANLRNQADVLQGQRFAESARRSQLLQSMFNDKPGNLPSELDIYGDGAGQTGATVPQHGVVSGLNAQQASYNNYDELFTPRTQLTADVTVDNRNSSGEQIRAGIGNDTLGVSLAQRQYKTDGFGLFNNLDNKIWQATLQWQLSDTTKLFASHQSFNSQHGEIDCPADPVNCATSHQYGDRSNLSRLGFRYSLDEYSELRGLISHQQTSQSDNYEWMSDFFPPSDPAYTTPVLDYTYGIYHNDSSASGVELQYRHGGTDHAIQWGVSSVRSPLNRQVWIDALTNVAQRIYVDWQQVLSPYWQLETGLAWGKNDKEFGTNSTYLRRWQPKLGMIYTPDSATHVRFAAWKNLDDAAVGNASLAATSLAGIVLNRPGDTYKLVQSIAIGADKQLDSVWLLDGQMQRRWTDNPVSGANTLSRNQIDESALSLHWQHAPLSVALAYNEEFLHRDPTAVAPDSILKQHLYSQHLSLRWLASAQWSANLTWSHNQLFATQQLIDTSTWTPTILNDIADRFNQTDASLNWRFSRTGSMDVGVRNATDRKVLYTEPDPLMPRFSRGRLCYTRLKLEW